MAGAVHRVNVFQNQEIKFPSSAEEGWPKAGVVLVKKILVELEQHHPVCANYGGFAKFF